MRILRALILRVRQFGVRRSVAIYLMIVVGIVLASELAVGHIVIGQESGNPAIPALSALALAALVAVFVFSLFQNAIEDREREGVGLAQSEARFRSLTGLSADWFWETDADHRLSWIAGGQSMLKLFGSSLTYGRRPWEIKGIEVPAGDLAAHLETIERRKPFHELQLCRPAAGGECGEFHLISGEPRLDSAGRFAGYRGVGRDVTAMKSAERALSGANDRLEMALDAGALAIWDSDLVAGRLFVSEGWGRMIGEPGGPQSLSMASMIERVHKQDVEAVTAASRRAIKAETPSFLAEFRLRTASGGWKWIVSSGKVVARDASGRALRMTGTAMDVDRRRRAELAIRDAEARYRTLIDLSPDAILLQSDGRIEYANRAASEILGLPGPAALVGREIIAMVHPADRAIILERARWLRNGPGKTDFLERRMLRADAAVVTVEGASVSYLERGRLVVQTVLRDISDKVRAREALAEREQRFRDVVEAAGEYVWETDAEFRFTWLSDRVEAVLGYGHTDLLGRRPHEFMPLGEERAAGERLAGHRDRAEPFRGLVHRSITKSGRVIWQSISGVPVFDAAGMLRGFRGTGADITAKRQAEERIQYLATRDALTGLPNRQLLADRAGQALLDAGSQAGRIAVLSIKLDRFQRIGDTLGHRAGDGVLRAVAERLTRTLGRDDMLARLDGDEFVLLWDGTRETGDVASVAQRVLDSLTPPVVVEDRTLNVSASIGISVFPGDGRDFDALLRNAVAALHAAREPEGHPFRFSSRELNLRALERLETESDLRGALARDEFVLLFQPVIGGGSDRIIGAEVFLYWRHRTRGLLPPEDFFALADQTGLMGALGRRLIEKTCRQLGLWSGLPYAGLWFALNASFTELLRDGEFANVLAREMKDNAVAPSRVFLEIAGRDMQHGGDGGASVTLRTIADLGVRLAVDDFGTGQFNLVALRQLPVSKLKVDRSLVSELAEREDAAIIMETLAAMAKGLGLVFAAEGVDSGAQLVRLQALGCVEWQGPLYSGPLEAAAFEARLGPARLAESA